MADDLWKYKNVVCYTTDPGDKWSRELLDKLNANPKLADQFLKIQLDNPKLTIPPSLKQFKVAPILILNGIDKPLLGVDAVNYFITNGLQISKQGGVDSVKNPLVMITDDLNTGQTEGVVGFGYNRGFVGKDPLVSSHTRYERPGAAVSEGIKTFEELGKGSSAEFQKRLSQRIDQRMTETPRSDAKIGFEIPTVTRGPSNNNDAYHAPAPTYNPRSFAPPQASQSSSHTSQSSQSSQSSRSSQSSSTSLPLPSIIPLSSSNVLGGLQVPRSMFNPSL